MDRFLHGARRQFFTLTPSLGNGAVSALEWGPPQGRYDLVFLHANGFNAATYAPLLGPMAQQHGFRILAIDLRGHGRNTLVANPTANPDIWQRFGDDLLALMSALEAPPRVLAGHSMGGATCLMAGMRWPEALGQAPSLVLFDPVVVPSTSVTPMPNAAPSLLVEGAMRRKNAFDSREAAFAAYKGRGAFRTWPDEFLQAYLCDGLDTDDQGVYRLSCAPAWEANNFRYPFHGDETAINALNMPITLLRAEQNSTCRWTVWPDHVHDQQLPGTTHFVPMERVELARDEMTLAIHKSKRS